VAFGDVVLIALPAPAVVEVLSACGSLDGTILIHAANGFGANAITLAALSERFPGARCVRAYNTLQAHVLEDGADRATRLALLLSGDDQEAKRIVSGLIVDSGFAPVDIGGTEDAVLQDLSAARSLTAV
jgi:predicted dinucleotide-binding enzyme